MRLVACSNCHAQYDVADVEAKSVTCRCGEPIDTGPLRAIEATVCRCSACGGSVDAEADACSYCGSAIERCETGSLICPECFARCADAARFCTACGVAFSPEPLEAKGQELPCPVCTSLMPPHQVGGIGLNECASCRGLWIPGEGFDALVNRAIDTPTPSPDGQPSTGTTPRVTGSNPALQRVQYRKCPECDGFMQRRNYRKKSGVVIDSCPAHGTWLDADELERIAGFLRSARGESLEREDSEQRRQRAIAAAAIVRLQPQETRLDAFEDSLLRPRGSGGVVGSLLGLLTDLLD